MNRTLSAAAMAVAFWTVAAAAWAPSAQAHVVCGDRVFPATLIMDDPGVGDELSLPTIQYTRIPEKAGGGELTDYGFEWDKTITEHFGFALNADYPVQRSGGVTTQGWDVVTLTLKDEFLCSESNEFASSFGVIHSFGGTGTWRLVNANVISATGNVGSTAPTFYAGKGLGDLLPGYLRPLAVTGEIGYAISDSPSVLPNELDYAFSLQYSVPYLDQHVKALGLPEAFTHIVPLVEFSFQKPDGQSTTGTIAPGILYEGDSWQFGVEATIPATSASWQSSGLGFIAQFHLFLDDIFPNSLGKPLFSM